MLFSGGAPGTRPTRSASTGLGMGVTWPVSSKQRQGTVDRVGDVYRYLITRLTRRPFLGPVRRNAPPAQTQAFPRHGGQACGCPVHSGCALDSLGRVRRELHFRHRDAETDSTSAPGIRRGDRRIGGAPEEVASLGDLVCSPICQLTSFSSRWLIYSSTAAAIRPDRESPVSFA